MESCPRSQSWYEVSWYIVNSLSAEMFALLQNQKLIQISILLQLKEKHIINFISI